MHQFKYKVLILQCFSVCIIVGYNIPRWYMMYDVHVCVYTYTHTHTVYFLGLDECIQLDAGTP